MHFKATEVLSEAFNSGPFRWFKTNKQKSCFLLACFTSARRSEDQYCRVACLAFLCFRHLDHSSWNLFFCNSSDRALQFSALHLQLAQTVILSLNYVSTCVLCLFWGVRVGCLFLKYLYGIFIKKLDHTRWEIQLIRKLRQIMGMHATLSNCQFDLSLLPSDPFKCFSQLFSAL